MSSPRILPIREARSPEPSDELLSLGEVCRRLATNPLNVYSLQRRLIIRSVVVGKQKKYISGEVDALAIRLRAFDPDALRAANVARFLLGSVRGTAA